MALSWWLAVVAVSHLTVVPEEEGEVQAMYSWYVPKNGGTTTSTGCEGCH